MALVITVLTVKIINYSQPPSKIKNDPSLNFFTDECIDQVKYCSKKITKQSRVEEIKRFMVIPEEGTPYPSMYVRTSHTDIFPGFVVDGIYTFIPNPQIPEIPVCSVSTCTIVSCQKRINAVDTD